MPKLFSNIFTSVVQTYHYNLHPNEVISIINKVFKKSSFFSGPDISGRFETEDSFVFTSQDYFLYIPASIYPSLTGKILSQEINTTTIEVHIESGLIFKFYFAAMIGVGSLVSGISFSITSVSLALIGTLLFFAGPFFINWLAGLSVYALQDRYVRYMHTAIHSK